MKNKRLTPKETIHASCHYCVQSRSDGDVDGCTGYLVYATGGQCPFYDYRLGTKRPPIKLFRQFCLDCMGGSKEAVRECETLDCLNYPFRFGKNPSLARRGKGRDEMARISALKKPLVKGISGKFERTERRP